MDKLHVGLILLSFADLRQSGERGKTRCEVLARTDPVIDMSLSPWMPVKRRVNTASAPVFPRRKAMTLARKSQLANGSSITDYVHQHTKIQEKMMVIQILHGRI